MSLSSCDERCQKSKRLGKMRHTKARERREGVIKVSASQVGRSVGGDGDSRSSASRIAIKE